VGNSCVRVLELALGAMSVVSEYVLVGRKILELRQDFLKLRLASKLNVLSFSEKEGRKEERKERTNKTLQIESQIKTLIVVFWYFFKYFG
jgi:hypothetical protein